MNKLKRLPVTTQKALQQLACIGNSADAAALSAVLETSEKETEADLWEALQQELIVRSDRAPGGSRTTAYRKRPIRSLRKRRAPRLICE